MGNCQGTQDSRQGNLNLLCCSAGDSKKVNSMTEVIPAKDDEFSQIRANAQAMRALIKMQALVRGHVTRQQIKRYQMSVKMSDKDFGNSVTGDFTNRTVKKIQDKLGTFQFQTDFGQELQNGQNNLEFRSEQKVNNNVRYEGQWITGTNIRQGRGRQTWKDGTVYEGWFRNDKAEGKGRLIHADGDIYNGDWKDDKAQGHGNYTHSNGAGYEGQWINDKQHGMGKETWPDGSSYEGEYKMGLKNGKGKFSWEDGNSYEGDFEDNNIQGHGTYTWKDGRVFEGTWINNKMHGYGVFTWTDGRRYEGEYKNDQKEGHGTFKWPTGRQYVGQWKNGKMDGEGTYTAENGKVKKGQWKDGKKVASQKDQNQEQKQ